MKEKIIDEIIEREWSYFSKLNNIGGKAECQNNKEDFIIMRKAQWLTFNLETLSSYLDDLKAKINPVFQKYAEMMRNNMPDEYENIEIFLDKISESKKGIVGQIMNIYMKWEEEFFEKFPIYSSMGRPLYSNLDTFEDTSVETYLRGELYSYSEKTLKIYFDYILEMKNKKINLAIQNMDYLAKLQGFENSMEVEKYYKNLKKY